MIQYVQNKDIDKHAWDNCIANAENTLIYACYDYLSAMATNWDAIIISDYDAVMPIPYREKLGVRYAYQPAFVQQGGVFFKKPISPTDLEEILILLQSKFRFAEIALNYKQSSFTQDRKFFDFTLRNNFTCDLRRNYSDIHASYSASTKQRITRGEKESLQFVPTENANGILRLYKEMISGRTNTVKNADYTNFEKLCGNLQSKGQMICRAVYDNENQQLAACILLADERRLYNIVSYQSKHGREKLANYTLYDSIIKEFAGKYELLDFEGSDLKGVAEFYGKFANKNEQYPFLSYNNLPSIVKKAKSLLGK